MRVTRKVSIDIIFNKLYRDLGLEEISEDDVVSWAGEVLEHIGVVNMLEEHVAFIEVNNHKAELPSNLTSIIQVARNNKWQKDNGVCHNDLVTSEPTETCLDCVNIRDMVPLDCRGRLIGDYEVAYYRPYFDLQYEYYGWSQSDIYRNNFSPVRLSNKTFFSSMVCEEDERIYQGVSDEYTLVDNTIRLSFKEGQIALAFYAMALDPDTGYPMIPDEVSVIQAIVSYITYKYMQRLWYMGREGYGDKYRQAQEDYNWYIGQAKNKLFGPYGIDDFEDLMRQGMGILPNYSKYQNFFSGEGYKEMIRTRRR